MARLAFKGLRRATLTQLLKVLNSLTTMDNVETAVAARQQRGPVLFMSDANISFSVNALIQTIQACLTQVQAAR